MRSAIALVGFGVVIVKLRVLRLPLHLGPGNGWRVGLLFALIGLLTILGSAPHYFNVRRSIEANTYCSPNGWILLFSTAILFLGIGVIYFVFASPLEIRD
jgi:putative membrane protein